MYYGLVMVYNILNGLVPTQTKLVEKHIEDELKSRMPEFCMKTFMKSLELVINCIPYIRSYTNHAFSSGQEKMR